MASTFLTASWRKLIMAQYEVDPAILAPWLPPDLQLDLYRVEDTARCYVSLVGFLFGDVRVLRCAIPFHTSFEEINLRFYVTRTEADGTRKRGVVFVREFVSRPAITVLANLLYEEPYATGPTRHSIVATPGRMDVSYAWRHRGAWQSMAVEASDIAQPIAPGSEEEFITEHYWGYTKRSHGKTSEYAVQHPRWAVYPVRSFTIEADFAALYGAAFASLTKTAPASVLLAEGSEVSVSTGSRLRD